MDSATEPMVSTRKIDIFNDTINSLCSAVSRLELTMNNIAGNKNKDEPMANQEFSTAELFTSGQNFLQLMIDRVLKVDETLKETFF